MTNNTNYSALSMDEIIFLDRNQNYGAFDIRKSYPNHIKRAIIGMITLVTSLLSYQELSAYIHPMKYIAPDILTVVNVTEIPKDKPIIQPEKKMMPPKGNLNAAMANFAEMNPSRHAPEDSLTPVDEITPDLVLGDHREDGTAGPKGDPKGTDVKEEVTYAVAKPIQTVDWTDVMPEYPGGEDELIKLIARNTEYPEMDKEMNRQGTVVVGFVIDENGKVTDRQVIKSASSTMDREAMRVIGLLKTFKPGLQAGHPVKVRYKLPIRYRLSGEQ